MGSRMDMPSLKPVVDSPLACSGLLLVRLCHKDERDLYHELMR